ncbi:UbiA family prenyltransferase [Deinococcus maricopensis]|uniref:UbiA prenyltransferase n=1 Tax=Deinococcus maricopensis (strain DSM 21211 / LMG 22137 / NRRL B-23946 / LB-34) TaxID=709986 RepID=E8U6Y0_DEIML|nr:UbiA family prenyltransferase [Deinococcus maricopensis]ADV66819.1 UbiA prenyltransferase [Deinococcus maricopensis DSM 21211]
MTRWLTYQRERFPLARHVPLVTLTSACVLAYSAHARGATPPWAALVPATLIGLTLFAQLRVLDEFKDAAEDAAHRPYRPVPRGLVSLRELAGIGVALAALQLLLTLALRPAALPLLLLTWTFMLLMHRDFFLTHLHDRPGIVLLTHQPVVPLVQLSVSAWDWAGRGASAGALTWLAVASVGAGLTLEIGRKLRAPQAEEPGVTTYTAAWGARRAVLAWSAAAITGAAAVLLGTAGQVLPAALALGTLAPLLLAAAHFPAQPTPSAARRLEPLSAVAVLGVYLGLAFGRPA